LAAEESECGYTEKLRVKSITLVFPLSTQSCFSLLDLMLKAHFSFVHALSFAAVVSWFRWHPPMLPVSYK
jgi:hypothetical protein